MLHIHSFVFNSFAENTYVVYDDTKACAVVDPGCYGHDEQERLSTFIEAHGLKVTHLINTHAHVDHVLGNWYIAATYGVPLALHRDEVPMLAAAVEYAAKYGFEAYKPIKAGQLLAKRDIIQLGNTALKVMHVPGHSPGHIALYSQEAKLCLSGDVLFRGSIGRTDLPGCDRVLLLQSIHQQLFSLANEVVIYPGHGPTTTVGEEKKSNPFCKFSPTVCSRD